MQCVTRATDAKKVKEQLVCFKSSLMFRKYLLPSFQRWEIILLIGQSRQCVSYTVLTAILLVALFLAPFANYYILVYG